MDAFKHEFTIESLDLRHHFYFTDRQRMRAVTTEPALNSSSNTISISAAVRRQF